MTSRHRTDAAHEPPDMGYAMSHAEIAAALGVSRQRVVQIQQEALRKLRALVRQRGICCTDFFDDEGKL